MVLSFLLAASLGSSPAAAEPAASPKPPAGYQDAVKLADDAWTWANSHYKDEPETAIHKLEDALNRLESFGDVVHDDEIGRDLVVDIRLSLARTSLEVGDEARAEQLIDDLLRLSDERPIPFVLFGPRMQKRSKERRAALDAIGKGTFEVTCLVGCVITVNGYPSEDLAPGESRKFERYLGSYHVVVRATEAQGPPPRDEQITLTAEQRTAPPITFDKAPVVDPCSGSPLGTDTCPNTVCPQLPPGDDSCVNRECPGLPPGDLSCKGPPPVARMLPLWLESAGIVAGVGVATLGAVMLGYDGRCEDPSDSVQTCPLVYETTVDGSVTLAVGLGVAITSAVVLTIDQRRVKRQKREREHRARLRLTPGGVIRF